ncbi:MAG TPA: DUF3237 domain-containing protein [Stellaceae bacterium]|nr:DUF3237 domain-containing protein [Stellaceae bacterium]
MPEIRTSHLFTVTLAVGTIHNLGRTPLGDRRVAVVTGGRFEGQRLKGTVQEGGSDWILIRPDGSMQLDVRLTLETADGAVIGMRYSGYRHGPAAVLDRLNRGEQVDPASYYFRIAPLFETSSAQYDWINRIVGVGTGVRLPQGPVYDVFEVL